MSTKKSTTKKTTPKKKVVKKSTTKKTVTRRKQTKKVKKAFTLIELLAVIIILGILMLVAIPSVTTYISNSRKEAYVDTVKQLIRATINKVNGGKLDIFDMDTTYYLPVSCVTTENSKRTPYGDFVNSYVVFTYDGVGFDYYYTGTDTSKVGILLTSYDIIDVDHIETGIKKSDIDTTIGVANREKIVILDCDGNKEETLSTDSIDSHGRLDTRKPDDFNINDYTLKRSPFPYTREERLNYESVSFVRNMNVPENALEEYYPAMTNKKKIVVWSTDKNNNGLRELYIGSNYKIYGNEYCGYLFDDFLNVKVFNFANFDTSRVTNMNSMFRGNGTDATHDMSVEHIYGLEHFNTSNVTDMGNMFEYCSNLYELNLSSFNTKKVKNMERMFSGWFHGNGVLKVVDASNFDLSSVEKMNDMFDFSSSIEEVRLGKNKATKLTTVEDMFQYTYKLKYVDVSKIPFNSNVNTNRMFDSTGSSQSNVTIYVDSTESRDYIMNSTNMWRPSRWTVSNFTVK